MSSRENLQTLLLVTGQRQFYEGCPGCVLELRKQNESRLPYRDLLLLGLLVLCNALPISSLFPFVYFMVRDFHISDTAGIGYYAGYIGAAFMFGRFLTSGLWGIAADKYGRKPVMLIGVSSVIIFNTLFGMSTNIWMAVSTRFVLGVFNGLLGPVKAYASEICRVEQQAVAISVVGTMLGIGLIVGPAIGGFFAQPAEKYPKFFSSDSLFARYPYLLPCLLISLMAVVVFITTWWLPESLHKHPLAHNERGADDRNGEIEDYETQKSSGEHSKIQKKNGKSLLKNWAAMSSIIIYCIFSLHQVSYTEVFSLWAESPKADGGLSLSSNDVGTILAITGFGMLVFQLLFYPSLERLVGAILLTRAAAVLTIPVLTSYPFIAKLPDSLTWIVINCASLIKNMLSVTMLTSMFIFLNNSVPQEQRGAANGLSMTAQSLFKTIGPVGGGSIFAWTQRRQHASFLPGDHLVFFLLNVIIAMVFIMTFEPLLPSSTDKPPQESTAEIDEENS